VPGFQELLVIAVIALLVFGPERLPEMARNVAQMLGKFRAETQRNVDELRSIAEIQDLERELGAVRRELRGVTSSVTDTPTRSPARDARHTLEVRPDDQPPPFDPEAT
jgi:sec-independent protein translocase protein TatB